MSLFIMYVCYKQFMQYIYVMLCYVMLFYVMLYQLFFLVLHV